MHNVNARHFLFRSKYLDLYFSQRSILGSASMRREVEIACGGDKQTVGIAVESASGESGDSGKAVTASAGEVEGKAKGGCLEVDLERGSGDLDSDWERLCRICHLSAELVGSAADGWELIEIGCGCKGELAIAHRRCSEAWFRVKGNRIGLDGVNLRGRKQTMLCEICGENAKNILGKDDSSFMEVWHEGRRRLGSNNNGNTSNRDSYWTRQRFCSYFISFLAIAFILQWYFRASFS